MAATWVWSLSAPAVASSQGHVMENVSFEPPQPVTFPYETQSSLRARTVFQGLTCSISSINLGFSELG